MRKGFPIVLWAAPLLLVSGVAVCARESADLSPVEVAQLNPSAMPIGLDRGAPGLTRCLLQLKTRASMLMITAHPDDEDGGMLAYETREAGARTALLTLTRGEGGQNAMSPDFYDAMGLMRTQELLESDRWYGVDQYWGTVIDYGFSKTREEALEKWGYDRVLSDAVRVVRMTRPLVVTSVFVGAPTDGHGNHQVAGQMAQEVFLAAGDPNRFPEQIKAGLRPWKPLKVYERVPIFAPTKQNTIFDYATDKYVPIRFFNYITKEWIDKTPSTDVSVPEGSVNQAAGLTALQIGREGWGYQKSQNGGGTLPPPSIYSAPYHRYASRLETTGPEKSFYDGIDISLKGLASLATGGDTSFLRESLAQLSECVAEAERNYRPNEPAKIAPTLAQGLKLTRNLLAKVTSSSLAEPGKSDIAFELDQKAEQFEHALNLALGLSFQATIAPEKEATGPFAAFGGPPTTFTIAIPGQRFAVRTQLLNGGPELIAIRSVELSASEGNDWKITAESASPADLASGKSLQRKFAVEVPNAVPFTRAYYERPNLEQPYYDLTDERFRNLSVAPYPLYVSARVALGDVAWDLHKLVQTNTRIEGIGIEQEPLLTAPAISVWASAAAGAVPLNAVSFGFSCALHSNVKGTAKGKLRLQLPDGWLASPSEYSFGFNRDGDGQNFSFRIKPAHLEAKQYRIEAIADYNGKTYRQGYRMVGYSGLRPYPYYRPATYRVTAVDVRTAPGIRVGYFPGTGDDVPRALEDLGVKVQTLSGGDLESSDLKAFDAIVLGVRAYGARPEVRANNRRLLDYVKQGGVLVVQYNTQTLDEGYGPYSFSFGPSAQKVVDENSQVQILDGSSTVLNWPNKITEGDFSGWQEERGHGFMEKWDTQHYQAPLEMHDPDQAPQRGGLLIARYGDGYYVYDALALYRQLPSGVGGAYRILANLISLGKSPKRN